MACGEYNERKFKFPTRKTKITSETRSMTKKKKRKFQMVHEYHMMEKSLNKTNQRTNWNSYKH